MFGSVEVEKAVRSKRTRLNRTFGFPDLTVTDMVTTGASPDPPPSPFVRVIPHTNVTTTLVQHWAWALQNQNLGESETRSAIPFLIAKIGRRLHPSLPTVGPPFPSTTSSHSPTRKIEIGPSVISTNRLSIGSIVAEIRMLLCILSSTEHWSKSESVGFEP